MLIAESSAHIVILENNFMTENTCDVINSEGIIQFGDQRVPFVLYRSRIHVICFVICTGATKVGPNEVAVIPCLRDEACQYGN